ncbi:MAG: hypothetical protein GX858_06090 [Clostridiales bacterium]|jgi:hypothetical protein|nr:hypothetical protein [Clostridiales bacterium]
MPGKEKNINRSTNQYSKKAEEKIAEVMKEFKEGTLKSSSGEKVENREQAIAIGISEARRKGYKTPPEERKNE